VLLRYLLLDVDGLDPSEGDLDGIFILQHACRNGHTAIADLLWSMPNDLSGVDVATEMKACMHMVANHKQQGQMWANEAKESHQSELELQKEVEELKAAKAKEEQQMRKQMGELVARMSALKISIKDTVRLRKDEQQKIFDE
jgi:ankyrin repeat protein